MSILDTGTLERKEQLLEAVFGAMKNKAWKWLSRRDVPMSRRLHVATSQRHDVESTMQKSTSKNVATLQRPDISSRSASYHFKYEWLRKGGIERRTNEGTKFQSRVTQTSRKCPGFVLFLIVDIILDCRMMFLILKIFIVSFIMF